MANLSDVLTMLQQFQQAPVRGLAQAAGQQIQSNYGGLQAPLQQTVEGGFDSLSRDQKIDFIRQSLAPAIGATAEVGQITGHLKGLLTKKAALQAAKASPKSISQVQRAIEAAKALLQQRR